MLQQVRAFQTVKRMHVRHLMKLPHRPRGRAWATTVGNPVLLPCSCPDPPLVYNNFVQVLTQLSQSHRKPDWYRITASRLNNHLARLIVSLQAV